MPGHRSNTKTLHLTAKNHEQRIAAEEARTYSWSQVTSKPTTFAPTAHAHVIGDITNLQATLDGKASVTHTHTIANVSGLQSALDTKPTLVGGKLPTSYLDQVKIGETITVADEAAMLALVVNPGDVAVRSDNDTLWMLKKLPATALANWWDLTSALSGVAGVTSINTMTGTVTLGAADVGAVPTARSMSAGTGLTGGGDLTANRTLSLSSSTVSSLTKADTAVQGFMNGTQTSFKLEKLTAAQYAALGTKDANTIYLVTA